MLNVKDHTQNAEVLAALEGFRPAGELGDGALWSYITGVRGINRIRVYERSPGGSLYYEFYDQNGRHQRALTNVAEEPITDRALAMYLADQMAEGQARKRNAASGRRFLNLPERHTLEQLFEQHVKDHPDWSEAYRKMQERHARFWLRHLGPDTYLADVTPARARQAIMDEDAQNENFGNHLKRDRLAYLMEAYRYAVEHLKWLDPADDMQPLKQFRKKLKTERVTKDYSTDEVGKLLHTASTWDLRVCVFAHLAWISGRRPKSIRHLRTEHYSTEDADGDEYGVLRFEAAHDKAGQEGSVRVHGRTKEMLERLLATPAVQASGWLFPSGTLDDATATDRVSQEWLRLQWHEVEEAAGVEHITRRSYYGLKRRYVTMARRLDPQAASKQSGVSEETMRYHYEQDDPEPKRRLAKHLDELVYGSENGKPKVPPVKVPDAFGRTSPETQEQQR